MTEKEILSNQAKSLRQKAEEKAIKTSENLDSLSLEDTRQILHELRVHQIELEMQNDELRKVQTEIDVARMRYFDIFDLAPVGYLIISDAGLVQEANLTATSLLGVFRGEMIKQPFTRFIFKEDQDIYYLFRKHLFMAHSADADQTAKSRACELRMMKEGREAFWVRLEATDVQDTEGLPVCRIMMSDISDRKRAEESLRKSEKVLRATLAQKEMLLKEVHHRVKNNLQVISSMISLQADMLPDKQYQGAFRDLQNRVRSIALVHEMLYHTDDLAQLEFAEYAVSLLQYLWRAHGAAAEKVRLNTSLVPLILPIETAVPCGLILTELITNTFKHAFSNGGEVTVTLEHNPSTGDVCLRVHDNGAGLPDDLDWRQSRTLGLNLVQLLAGQIHGSVQTGLGTGTEFHINFKL